MLHLYVRSKSVFNGWKFQLGTLLYIWIYDRTFDDIVSIFDNNSNQQATKSLIQYDNPRNTIESMKNTLK